ncbi:hypothetical protein Ahy_A02g009922 isoform A [Arachis hypogaea]|uniref:R13L1/DRL21-like LRR repeat region domain-containing protein n=1 Tax=Arachis hypogaea TaxID=3818 RepID=A0A445EIT5_ARAHY|nr:hypothetical protein Ahy_A02g009922 isoform A [Arachis hypogaea]
MHDLLHDLAIFLAGDFYCRIEEPGEQEEMKVLTRHLSYLPRQSLGPPITKVSNSIAKLESLRTSLYINDLFSVESVLSKFKYLRVLSFWKFDELPDSIGELIHLRYLNLSCCEINRLPESLCNLYNLQTLILYRCTKLTMLPSGMHNLVNLRHLDLRETSLDEMPGGISKLEHLHTLSSFVVGNNEDNGIQELGGLSNLHGSLKIKKLENVVDVRQATSARIRDKKHIDSLWLEWSSGGDMVSNTQTEREILHSLEPHNGLKELTIWGYRGTIFPDWLGNPSYSKMTHVSLVCCMNCCMLPSLGQLPSLKSLDIQDFGQLSSIGTEFYKNEGNPSLQIAPSFPLLERLKFDKMACWEEWHLPDSKAFPQLKSLQIIDCPVLKGDTLYQGDMFKAMISSNHLSCLQEIEISECSSLISLSLDAFPTLKVLEIKWCSNLESVSMSEPPPKSLQNLRIMNCRKLEFLQQQHKYDVESGISVNVRGTTRCSSTSGCESVVKSAFNVTSINHLCCLQEVHISDCSSAVSFPGNCLPKSLQKLTILTCPKFVFPEQQQHKYDLVELQIEGSCDSLTSFLLDAFPNIKTLKISRCSNLESVSMSEPPHAALQRLTISGCHKFVLFPEERLDAPNLTHLNVSWCSKLEALPRDMNALLPSLHSLNIHGCRKICRLPEGGLPPNLKQLTVGSQWKDLLWMGNLDALTRLSIHGRKCESIIKSFPEVGSLPHLPSLTTLHLFAFENLETLECNELLHLTSLQHLHIEDCWKLENMAGEKLPSSLLLLQIKKCPLLGEQCKKKHQQIWPKISHIPTIHVLINFRGHNQLSKEEKKNLDSISKVESLRTFLPTSYFSHSDNIDGVTSFLILKFKRLRVLSFFYSKGLTILPDSISDLTYLRYLNLSGLSIKTLPESLCDLYNLQTLKLNECSSLIMLPNGMHKLVNLQHLYIGGTCLKEMPRIMRELKQLHALCYFIVGKQEDNGIQELGGLLHLRGSFEIKKLENVVDAKQARSVRIIDKECIYYLLLKWSLGDDLVSSTERERDILDSLQPHNSLKYLRIKGYKGTIFPDWLGHCSYNNMTSVSLESCNNCCMLPSLGQLPSLKALSIRGFGQLKSVGIEFYKNEDDHDSSPGYAMLRGVELTCLRSFTSAYIPYCRELSNVKGRYMFRKFTNNLLVKTLKDVFQRCHLMRKLEFPKQEQQKFNLEKLKIDSCDSLTSLSLDAFPSLKTLKIRMCENVESVSMSQSPHTALHTLIISFCSKFVSFLGEGLAVPNLTHFDSLEIEGCPEICRLPEGGLPPNLKRLRVGGCEKQLRDLSSMGNLEATSHLEISGVDCESFKSYPDVGLLPHLPTLTTLEIWGFDNLETLECNQLPSLQRLTLCRCQKLENMAGEKLPSSLLLLQIRECPLLAGHCQNKRVN